MIDFVITWLKEPINSWYQCFEVKGVAINAVFAESTLIVWSVEALLVWSAIIAALVVWEAWIDFFLQDAIPVDIIC